MDPSYSLIFKLPGCKIIECFLEGVTMLYIESKSSPLGALSVFTALVAYAILALFPALAECQQTVEVSTAEEFIKALGTDKVISMKPGTYNLSSVDLSTDDVTLANVFDGTEYIISGLKNLTIKSAGPEKARIIISPAYANVLSFVDCENIVMEGVEAGHDSPKGGCTGGVLVFIRCKKIAISNCILFGSGTEGLTLTKTENLSFKNSVIKECTYGIMTLNTSKDISFENSEFRDNREYDLINISNCSKVLFDGCTISDNITNIGEGNRFCLFRIIGSTDIKAKNVKIENNTAIFMASGKDVIAFENANFKNNRFIQGDWRSTEGKEKNTPPAIAFKPQPLKVWSVEYKLKLLSLCGITFAKDFMEKDLVKTYDRSKLEYSKNLDIVHVLGLADGSNPPKYICENLFSYDTECLFKNGDYTKIAERLVSITQGSLPITEISDTMSSLDSKDSKVTVRFKFRGEAKQIEIACKDERIGTELIEEFDALLSQADPKKTFFDYSMNGQFALIGCLTVENLNKLREIDPRFRAFGK